MAPDPRRPAISPGCLFVCVCVAPHSHLAEVSGEACEAEALEAVHLVLTLAAVEAGRARTLVHVLLTVVPREARRARTAVRVHQVLEGRGQGSALYSENSGGSGLNG